MLHKTGHHNKSAHHNERVAPACRNYRKARAARNTQHNQKYITIKKAEHQRIYAYELWCWRRLESLLDCKEIQPVHPKGDHSWMFIGRADAEAETPIRWPPDIKELTHWKRP